MRRNARRSSPRLPMLLLSVVCALVVRPSTAVEDQTNGSDGTAPNAVELSRAATDDEAPPLASGFLPGGAARRQAAPDIYYLPDADGEFRRVLGFPYADFLRAWGIAREATHPQTPPRYALQDLRVHGRERGDVVEIVYEFKVAALEEPWTAVPVFLGSEFIVEHVHISQPNNEQARSIVSASDDRSGLTLWLVGAADSIQSATIRGLLPIRSRGGERTVALNVPRAAASDVQVEIAGNRVTAQGASEAGASQTRTERGTTIARYRDARGLVQLSWRAATLPRVDARAAIEATASVSVDLAMNRVACKAEFELDTFGQTVERVRIELPPGATWTGGSGAYDMSVVDRKDPDENAAVDVQFPEGSADFGPIQLTYELPSDRSRAASQGVVAPTIVGAYRQHGAIAVTVDKQLQAYFDASGPIEQIPIAELPDALRKTAPAAAFAFSGSEWSLVANTQPQQPRVRVEPTYRMEFRPDVAELELQLDYQITGGRIFELQIDLAGWSLTEAPIESGGQVDHARVIQSDQHPLRLQLRDAVDESLSLTLVLRRPAMLGDNAWPLPTPQGAFVMPGTLTVASPPELRVTPLARGLTGVARTSDDRLAETSGVDSLAFETFSGSVEFAAELARRKQRVDVNVSVSAQADANQVVVSESFRYEVEFEPLKQANFLVPQQVWEADEIRWEVNGEPAPQPTLLDDANAPSGMVIVKLDFPSPLIGDAEVSLARRATEAAFPSEEWTARAVPLVMPQEHVRQVNASVRAAAGLHVDLSTGGTKLGWNVAADAPADDSELILTAEEPVSELHFAVRSVAAPGAGPVIVEKAWVQTWVAGAARQDRTTYRIRTDRDEVVVKLPETLRMQTIEVIVNGQRIRPPSSPSDQFAVPLTGPDQVPATDASAHVIEFRTVGLYGDEPVSSLSTAVPRLVDAERDATTYWQVLLPSRMIAVGDPVGMSGDYWQGWSGEGWGRQPTQNSRDLEQWIGASAGVAAGSGSNAYLFVAFMLPESFNLRVVPKAWVLAGAALAFLLLAAAVAASPLLRRPEAGLAAAVVVVAIAYAAPHAAMLIFQGLLAALAAACLMTVVRVFLRRSQRPGRQPTTAARDEYSGGGHRHLAARARPSRSQRRNAGRTADDRQRSTMNVQL